MTGRIDEGVRKVALSICGWTLIVLIVGLLPGCSGGASSVSPGTASRTGRARFTIQWPTRSRLIPTAANSIRIRVSQDATLIAERTLPRPTEGGTVNTTFNDIPEGQCRVNATAYPQADGTGIGQATAEAPINVQPGQVSDIRLTMESAITRLEVTPALSWVGEGGTIPLTATAKDATDAIVLTSALQWSSDNPTVATVTGAGVVTTVAGAAKKAAIITVTETESGKSTMATVNVISQEPASPWQKATTYQINPAHTGAISFGKPLAFPSNPTWSVDLGGLISYPIIADGRIFVTTHRPEENYRSHLFAMDAATGNPIWGPVELPVPISPGMTYENGRLFVLNGNGTLVAFDAATGAVLWNVNLSIHESFTSPPNAVNGIVYVVGTDGSGMLYAVNALTGEIRWTKPVQDGWLSSPTITPELDGLFLTYAQDQYRLDPVTGEVQWQNTRGGSGGDGTTSAYRNGLLYGRDRANPNTGTIYNAATGAAISNFSEPGYPVYIPAIGENLFALVARLKLRVLDVATRETLWTFSVPSGDEFGTAPLLINHTVVVGTVLGTVYALDAASGSVLWTNPAGAEIHFPDRAEYADPRVCMAAGEGYLVVPAGRRLTAWCIVAP